jgi:dolichyl-phosphate beta-glucosyltransferase
MAAFFPSLSVVIPAYNEANRIETSIHSIDEYLKPKKMPYEIIVVNDGSIDDTLSVLTRLRKTITALQIISLSQNQGKGAAFKAGVLQAACEFVLMTDADLSTPIEELEKMIPFINEFPMVVGSRAIDRRNIRRHQPRWRESSGILFNWGVRYGLGIPVTDSQCGFKVFRTSVIHSLVKEQTIDGFVFDVELLLLAKNHRIPFKEVGVAWSHTKGSKLSLYRHAGEIVREFMGLWVSTFKSN